MNLFDLYEQKYNELFDTETQYNESTSFKLPIQYINYEKINQIIKTDLEMPEIYKHLIGDSILLNDCFSN
jgi:hypothetical protein